MELVDMQDLGSCVERRVGSNPFRRTIGRLRDYLSLPIPVLQTRWVLPDPVLYGYTRSGRAACLLDRRVLQCGVQICKLFSEISQSALKLRVAGSDTAELVFCRGLFRGQLCNQRVMPGGIGFVLYALHEERIQVGIQRFDFPL